MAHPAPAASADDVMSKRDLSFKPVVNPAPRALTSDQIERYNTDGYIKPFPIFDDREVAANRAYFDGLLEQLKKDGRDSYAINCYHLQCEGIYSLALQPRILDLVEDIVGPTIICWATHYFCKMPFDTKKVPWHQDASYWALSPARTVTVWLAIDDADVENSCMHVIPGTHRKGHLAWREASGPVVLNQQVENAEAHGKPTPIDLKSGEISLHADMLVHGSEPNRSARRRCGLTLRYCPPEVRSVKPGWNSNGILCRGKDTTGNWVYPPRPSGNDLTPPGQRRIVIGAN